MAKAAGVSRHGAHQLWQKNGLKPHRTKTFKLSNDPRFEEKFWDVMGLHLNPPDKVSNPGLEISGPDEITACHSSLGGESTSPIMPAVE